MLCLDVYIDDGLLDFILIFEFSGEVVFIFIVLVMGGKCGVLE